MYEHTENQLDTADMHELSAVGILPDDPGRSATMVVKDRDTVCLQNVGRQFEMLPLSVAFDRYPWLAERYSFKAVPPDTDEFVASCAAQKEVLGFFIHVKKGQQVTLPCQAAMYMVQEDLSQIVHNIVILEEGAHLELVTGCVSHHAVSKGMHVSVEEYYIGPGAYFGSTMVHSWGPEIMVYPHTGAVVSEHGRYESNYIALKTARRIESNPQTYLNGEGASAKCLTVVVGEKETVCNTGGNVFLNAPGTGAELLHRGVSTGGIMHQGGLLIANAPCKGHVDCAGMLLDETGEGFIESIPGLKSYHPDARMSHEASIGKLVPDQVEYLMSRGMDEMQAISLLIRGFLGTDIEGLGPELDRRIAEIAAIAGHGEE